MSNYDSGRKKYVDAGSSLSAVPQQMPAAPSLLQPRLHEIALQAPDGINAADREGLGLGGLRFQRNEEGLRHGNCTPFAHGTVNNSCGGDDETLVRRAIFGEFLDQRADFNLKEHRGENPDVMPDGFASLPSSGFASGSVDHFNVAAASILQHPYQVPDRLFGIERADPLVADKPFRLVSASQQQPIALQPLSVGASVPFASVM